MRGFKDNIPPSSYGIDYVRCVFEKVSRQYGLDFIDMPIVEEASLYFRTSGDASDVCNKELFEARKYKGEFEDWVLRPEGTASCMRAIMEANFLQNQKFAKFAYFAPMFRYNRPQKGRYRQFLQAGWELIGMPGAAVDCELILGASEFLSQFNLKCVLEINSIGSASDRATYRDILRAKMNLGQEIDPLKVLDKAERIDEDIPVLAINNDDAREFEKLQNMLSKQSLAQYGIEVIHNPYLVRGLDYYNSTVFEFKVNGQAVLAGGRYDGLMQQIGGASVPATGFGAGVERIVENMEYQYINKNLAIIPVDANEYALHVAKMLREKKDIFDTNNNSLLQLDDYTGCVIFWELSLKKALQEADKQGYRYVVIAGANEAERNMFMLKDLVKHVEYQCCLKL